MHTTPGLLVALAAAPLLVLQGCGSSSNSGDANDADSSNDTNVDGDLSTLGSTPDSTSVVTDFSTFAGLYDASFQEGDSTDVIYVEIASDGTWTEYDFDGDDVDQGQNCYFIASGQIESLGGIAYRVSGEGFGVLEGTIVQTEGGLTVVEGDDESQMWPLVVNLSSTDFNECV